MGDKGGKKDKAKAEKLKQEQRKKKEEDKKAKMPVSQVDKKAPAGKKK